MSVPVAGPSQPPRPHHQQSLLRTAGALPSRSRSPGRRSAIQQGSSLITGRSARLPAFTSLLLQNSTNGATQASVSGLADGAYFWRVQAVNGAFEQGAWSQPRSFTVTGAGRRAQPRTAERLLDIPPVGGDDFHLERDPGSSYLRSSSIRPTRASPSPRRGEFNNIPDPTCLIRHCQPGRQLLRARLCRGLQTATSARRRTSSLFPSSTTTRCRRHRQSYPPSTTRR